jgi:hypothetical protein
VNQLHQLNGFREGRRKTDTPPSFGSFEKMEFADEEEQEN